METATEDTANLEELELLGKQKKQTLMLHTNGTRLNTYSYQSILHISGKIIISPLSKRTEKCH